MYKHKFGVDLICLVLTEQGKPIARTIYYTHKQRGGSARRIADRLLITVMKEIHAAHYSVYGIRKMWVAMRRAGYEIGRDRVARLMRLAGVKGIVRGDHTTRTTVSSPVNDRYADLVQRNWTPGAPNTRWVADFTYVWAYAGFVYVAFLLDLGSRLILGWRASRTKEATLVTDTLEQVITLRKINDSTFVSKGIIAHSDAGSQYTSLLLGTQLRDADMIGSIGTVGDAYDNAVMESVIGLYKTELINITH
jgi:putative transposase